MSPRKKHRRKAKAAWFASAAVMNLSFGVSYSEVRARSPIFHPICSSSIWRTGASKNSYPFVFFLAVLYPRSADNFDFRIKASWLNWVRLTFWFDGLTGALGKSHWSNCGWAHWRGLEVALFHSLSSKFNMHPCAKKTQLVKTTATIRTHGTASERLPTCQAANSAHTEIFRGHFALKTGKKRDLASGSYRSGRDLGEIFQRSPRDVLEESYRIPKRSCIEIAEADHRRRRLNLWLRAQWVWRVCGGGRQTYCKGT